MFVKEVLNTVTALAGKHLLEINEDSMHLYKHRRNVFYSVTEKVIYVTKISQPNIEPTVAFYVQRYQKAISITGKVTLPDRIYNGSHKQKTNYRVDRIELILDIG